MKSNEIKLYMKEPIITCYPNHANLLSVISQNKDYLPWVYSTYIQLFCDRNDYKKNYLRLDFYTNNILELCPFISHQKISRELLGKISNISVAEYIISCLEEGYYCYFLIDTYFIEKYGNHNRYHYVHDIFVFGVNLERKVFYAADNFKNGKYSFEEIPIQQIVKGYYELENNNLIDWLEGVHLIKYRVKNDYFGLTQKYQFDIEKVVTELEDYINSFQTPKRYANPHEQWIIYAADMAFGVDVYETIIQFLEHSNDYDLRPLYVLSEHKKIMLKRLEYLENSGYLQGDFSSEFTRIERETMIINNKYLKDRFLGVTIPNKRVIEKLRNIKNQERDILEKVILSIK